MKKQTEAGKKTTPTRKVNYGDRALGLDNSNDLEDGVPIVYRQLQDDRNPDIDPILQEDERFVAESRAQAQQAQKKSNSGGDKKGGIVSFPGVSGGGGRKSLAAGGKSGAPSPGPSGGRKSLVASGNSGAGPSGLGKNVASPQGVKVAPAPTSPSGKGEHTVVNVEGIEINFKEQEINHSLQILEKKSRVFIKRHTIHATRFDILDENGDKIFQIDDFTNNNLSTPLNYCVFAADGKTQLLILQGSPGFLGLNGKLTAYYPGSQPGDKELILGSVESSTPTCAFRPQTHLKNAEGIIMYELQDRNKYPSVLSIYRKWEASAYELVKAQKMPVVLGRIDERKLIVPVGVKSKIVSNARRSIAVGAQPTVHQKKHSIRLGSGGSPQAPPISLELLKASGGFGKSMGGTTLRKLSIESNYSNTSDRELLVRAGLLSRNLPVAITEVRMTPGDNVLHENFCIGFGDSLTTQARVLMIVGHLLVNDDYVRRRKTCTRTFFLIALFVTIGLFIVGGIVGAILGTTLGMG